MKARRIFSIILAISVMGSLCACKTKKTSETETQTQTVTEPSLTTETTKESTTEESVTKPTDDPNVVKNVEDESEEPITIYGYDPDFKNLMKKYLPDVECEYVLLEKDVYFKTLADALKSEEKTPDLFMCDKAHLQDYSYSNKTLNLGELGFIYSDLEDQFAYTYEAAEDKDHAPKALSYLLAPSVIIYNRLLAYKAFGNDDPSVVSTYLNSWDHILDCAQEINVNSEGKLKLFSSIKDIRETYWTSHTTSWIKDGKVVIGKEFDKYFHIEEVLSAESLTFDEEYGSEDWQKRLMDNEAVMFFGSLEKAKNVIGYVPGHKEDPEDLEANSWRETSETTKESTTETAEQKETKPAGTTESGSESGTTGESTTEETTIDPDIKGWAILPAPEATYDDGIWLMAASTCDKKATAAKILKTFTLDEATMEQMALEGMFVNSKTVMKKCAADPYFISDFLGGQNPYAVLVPIAEEIQVAVSTEENEYAYREIEHLLEAYLEGQIDSMAEVKHQFTVGMEELFGLT